MQRKYHMKTLEKDWHLQAKKGGLRRKKPTLLTPWSWTSSLRNHEETNFCCLRHPVYGTSLWQPQQIHTFANFPFRGLPSSYSRYWVMMQSLVILTSNILPVATNSCPSGMALPSLLPPPTSPAPVTLPAHSQSVLRLCWCHCPLVQLLPIPV